MTNSEAIKILKNIHSAQRTIMLSTSSKNLEDIMLLDCTALEMAEKALEENDKLKAEIDDIRINLDATYKKLHDATNICKEYQKEIEQLKSGLGKGVNEVKRKMLLRRWIYTNDATPVEVLGMDWANKMNDWCVEIIEEAEKHLKGRVGE